MSIPLLTEASIDQSVIHPLDRNPTPLLLNLTISRLSSLSDDRRLLFFHLTAPINRFRVEFWKNVGNKQQNTEHMNNI